LSVAGAAIGPERTDAARPAAPGAGAPTLVALDWTILHAVNDFAVRHDGFEDPVTRYVGISEIVFAAILAILFLLARQNARTGARAAVAAAASSVVALAAGQAISHLVQRPRPFVDHPALHVFASRSPDFSFPSDHATAAFAIAVAILLRSRPWGIVALVLAVVLAAGRVVVGVHYPTDVLAGAALGTAAALALWAIRPVRRDLDAVADRLARGRDRAYRRMRSAAR